MAETPDDVEMGSVPRGEMYHGDVLAWELDGERGVWDMCILFDNITRPTNDKVGFVRFSKSCR